MLYRKKSAIYVISRNQIILQPHICWSVYLEALFTKINGLFMTFRNMLFLRGGWCAEYDDQPMFSQCPTITPIHWCNTVGFCSCVTNHSHCGHTVLSLVNIYFDNPRNCLIAHTFPYCLAACLVAWSRLSISCALSGCYFVSVSVSPPVICIIFPTEGYGCD